MTPVKTYKMIKTLGNDKLPYWNLYYSFDDVRVPGSTVWLYGNLSYDKVKAVYDDLMAKEACVPVELTPPFPDTDPTLPTPVHRKFFKWFF
jgi:hypothetical protein